MNYKNILAIGAHPDDIEYGCLGLLKSYSSTADITLYIASLGSVADLNSGYQRKAETSEALSVIEAKRTIIREKKGILPANFQEILGDLEGLIHEEKPDLILTHGPNDTHQEHKLIYDILVSAARRTKLSIFRYSIVSNNAMFQPNFFFELPKELVEMKARQLAHHKSQSDKYYMTRDYIDNFHRRPYSQLHDIKYCEAYEVERIMV